MSGTIYIILSKFGRSSIRQRRTQAYEMMARSTLARVSPDDNSNYYLPDRKGGIILSRSIGVHLICKRSTSILDREVDSSTWYRGGLNPNKYNLFRIERVLEFFLPAHDSLFDPRFAAIIAGNIDKSISIIICHPSLSKSNPAYRSDHLKAPIGIEWPYIKEHHRNCYICSKNIPYDQTICNKCY